MEAGTTVQIRMPEMGESVTEGTILEWLVPGGDDVEAEQGLVEVSTDKGDTEGPSPASGVLTKIPVDPDEAVPGGTVLREISPGGRHGAPPRGEPARGGSRGPPPARGGGARDGAEDERGGEEAEQGAAAEEERGAAREAPAGTNPAPPAGAAPPPAPAAPPAAPANGSG